MKSIDKDDLMEAISLNKKENIIEAYSLKPTLPYDIEGILVEKEGKNIKVEKTFGDRNLQYALRLKEETSFQVGEKIKIDKEDILSMKVNESQEKWLEKSIDSEEIINELGFQDTEETRRAIEYLLNHNIPINKENLESFFMSKRYLEEIVENIDFDSCIKLLHKDIDIGEDSLQKIAEGLKEINREEQDISLIELFKSNKKLGYKEAEKIAKDIYGTRMGKDVYDSIIALDRQKMPINRENIERVMEVIDKLQDLREYDDEILVKALKEEATVNIENLYKLKHSYNTSGIDTNITSTIYDNFTIEEELPLEDILAILRELNLDEREENINLIRELVLNEVDITRDNVEKIMDLKGDLEELITLLDEVHVVRLIDDRIDPLKEDISKLVKIVKDLPPLEEDIQLDQAKDILKEVANLKSITYRDLINLIKSGKDFGVENLKEVISTDKNLDKGLNGKTAEKAITISNIFNTLGEVDSNTIAFAVKRYNTISLHNLYESQRELNHGEDIALEPISQLEESLIRQEYLNARSNTTLNIIRMSIEDGLDIEHMAIEELNEYIDDKMKARDFSKLSKRIAHMKGKEDILVSMAIKNHLNMSINQLNFLNDLLHSSNGLGSIIDLILKKQKHSMDKELKEGTQILENRIKEFSTSLKEGKDRVKEDYKDVLESLEDLSQSSDSNGREKDESMKQMEKYLELQDMLSKDDLILQLPMLAGEGYKNVNLIIPNVKKGIDKNNMLFYFNIHTEHLGELSFNLRVKGRDVSVDFEGNKEDMILENKNILESGLNRIGYNLKEMKVNTLY